MHTSLSSPSPVPMQGTRKLHLTLCPRDHSLTDLRVLPELLELLKSEAWPRANKPGV